MTVASRDLTDAYLRLRDQNKRVRRPNEPTAVQMMALEAAPVWADVVEAVNLDVSNINTRCNR
jgi:hypothetical protein